MLFSLLYNEFIDFLKFLNDRNILTTGIGLIIALQVNTLFLSVMEDLIKPVATSAISEDINKHYVQFYGIRIRIGNLTMSIINFTITMLFIFYLYKISMKAPSVFESMFGTLKSSVSTVSSTVTAGIIDVSTIIKDTME